MGNWTSVLPTRQPNASCFNFLARAQKKMKFFCTPQMAHLLLPRHAKGNPSAKAKEPFFANAQFKIWSLLKTIKIYS